MGDLALCDDHYDQAVTFYKEGLPLIVKYEVHGRYTVGEQIKQIEQRLQSCAPKDVSAALGKALTQFWKSEPDLIMKYPGALATFSRWIREGKTS